MKKLLKSCVIVLLAIALSAFAAGCKNDKPTEPDPDPLPPQIITPRPTPSPTPTPTPSPEPIADDVGSLQYGAYYYMFGDLNSVAFIFHEDGVIRDNVGGEGEYELEDDNIIISYENDMTFVLNIVDDYTLSDPSSGMPYIREGGEGFGETEFNYEEPPLFFHNKEYYLDGDEDAFALYFWDNGDVDIEDEDGIDSGLYTVDRDRITIMLDGRVIATLSILNCATLENSATMEIYALKGALDRELVLYDYYYMEGNRNDLGLYFRDEGEIDFNIQGIEMAVGEYSIEEFTVSIDLEGADAILELINSYILESSEGFVFIRLP